MQYTEPPSLSLLLQVWAIGVPASFLSDPPHSPGNTPTRYFPRYRIQQGKDMVFLTPDANACPWHFCIAVCSVVQLSHFLQPCEHSCPARLLCAWDFPSKNTGVFCHFLLQEISRTQVLNPLLLSLQHCRQILHCWATWHLVQAH